MEVAVSRWAKRGVRGMLLWAGLYGGYWALADRQRKENERTWTASTEAQDTLNLHPGDLVFFKYECSGLLTRQEMRRCYVEHAYKSLVFFMSRQKRYRQGEWDSVAVVSADAANKPRAIGFCNGKYRDYPAGALPLAPFVKELGIRRVDTAEENLNIRSLKFKQSVESVMQSLEDVWSYSKPVVFRDEVDLVLNFWVQAGLADINALTKSLKITVEDLNTNVPKGLGIGVARFSDIERVHPSLHS